MEDNEKFGDSSGEKHKEGEEHAIYEHGQSGAESEDHSTMPVPLDRVTSCSTHGMAPPPAQPMIEPTQSRATHSHASEDNSNNNDGEEYDFPEGGWRAWGVVFGSWCAMTTSFGFINAAGFIQAWLNEHQLRHKGESQVSWIFSVYLFLFFFGGVQVGPVFDAYGLKFVIIPGSIGIILSIFFLSLANEYYQFMLGFGILGGISSSMVFTPSIAAVGHWFYRRRGWATGIAATGGAVGGFVFPLAMNKMVDDLGFAWTIRVIGFVVMGLCMGGILTLRTRLPMNKAAGGSIDLRAFRDTRFLLACMGTFMIEWGIFVPLNYITTYGLSQGFAPGLAYNLPAYLNIGSVFGRCLPGYMADRFGRYNVMIFTATITSIFCLALWLPAGDNQAAVIAFAVLFGFWSAFCSFYSLKPRRATGVQGAGPLQILTLMWFSGGTPPDPQGSLRSRLWVVFGSFYSLKPRRATDVAPCKSYNSNVVFWGHALRPPGLASLEIMGSVLFFLFVEAPQSHGGAGGWPPANPNPNVVFWGHAPRPPGLASLEIMGSVLFFLFVEAPQSHGGAGGWPPANPNPNVVFWGHAPRPPGLASLDVMGSVLFFLFDEASQSHGDAEG
ncbi:hypothetical protein TRICI_005497 [Trichomonascus ciferrii]|uniref:Major facilitator superfamily (MFS) profile domain-containing protein n=1 Tax=Trichomonascus ciferrii TaxID=44093 RepID=A0A642UUB9_9ASCO|nr:hypothetical protein TRICI_005497 [Trichomonascus ciferrii]